MTASVQDVLTDQINAHEEVALRTANVSSVTLRSPFRFPGGKTWLVPYVRCWLSSRSPTLCEFCEPFVGGAIVALTVAAEELAERVVMAEVDPNIAAVWHTVLGKHATWLANRICKFRLTPRSLDLVLASSPRSNREVAFRTILRNRTFRGGILAHTSRPLKRGENGRGIKSRWYPETLRQRILAIADIRNRISFIEGDGLELIRQRGGRTNVAFFLDPPYTASKKRAGVRLYSRSDVDHEELFEISSNVLGDFLMTYEDSTEIRGLASKYGFQVRSVAMRNTHHVRMNELLIGRDLTWIRHVQKSPKSL
jgi:DNA adenine methylase